METPTTLNDSTIEALQDLTRINIDSARGFRTAAENVENSSMAAFFRECADKRETFAQELRHHVEMNDEDAADHGSIKGQVHRWWIDIRGSIQDGDEHAILAEAERGEDAIKKCYEVALKDVPGNALGDLLHDQYRHVKNIHDRVRDMRDAKA